MDIDEAKQKEKESLARQTRLSEIEQSIPVEAEAAMTRLRNAQNALTDALVALELGEVDQDHVKAIRAEIRKQRTILEDLPFLKKGIEARQQREKKLISVPQGVIRAALELEELKVEYFEAKARVKDEMQSEQIRRSESFKRRVLDLQATAEAAREEADYFGFVEAEGLRE